MKLFSFYTVVELLTFIAALLWCGKRASGLFRLFIPFMLYTVLTESTARLLREYFGVKNNNLLYVVYVPLEFLFFSYLLYNWIRNSKLKVVVKVSCGIAIAFAVVNAIWIEGFMHRNTNTMVLMAVLMVAYCFMYLFDLLQHSDEIASPLRLPDFWIVTGLLFFNLGGVLMITMYDFARINQLNWNGIRVFDMVYWTINTLLYGSFIIGFRLCYLSAKRYS
jgi:hypothetical protein